MTERIPTNRRRNYFIKKEFQTKFIMKFCILICLACFMMGAIVYLLSFKTVTTSFENLRLVAKSTADFIFPTLAISSLVAIILISLACIFIVLFVSHRIAGPLYRFETSVERIKDGDLTVHIQLRQKDEIKVLANSLNAMTKKIRDTVSASQQDIGELERELAYARERLNQLGISHDKLDEMFKTSKNKVNQLRRNFSYFKV